MQNENFIDQVSAVKAQMFTSDSGIYMMACTIACIAMSISLIFWYNKMMNDPYGRFDLRAIIKAVAILFFTINFHSFVLMPLDSMTTTVSKAIASSAQAGRPKLNEQIVRIVKERTSDLSSSLKSEMEDNVSQQDIEGLSYGTSSTLEAEAEAKVEGRDKKPGFFKRIMGTAKHAFSFVYKINIDSIFLTTCLLIDALCRIMGYVMTSASQVILIILGILGPLTFALSLIPGFGGNISAWLARYIQISFWMPIASIINYVNYHLKKGLMGMFDIGLGETLKTLPGGHLIVIDVASIVCIMAIPAIASWIVSSSGAQGLKGGLLSASKMASAATK